jgi:hypothetical protein
MSMEQQQNPNSPADGQSFLTDVLSALMTELANYHPLHEPGMWNLTVDQIRATVATMEAERGIRMRSALGG